MTRVFRYLRLPLRVSAVLVTYAAMNSSPLTASCVPNAICSRTGTSSFCRSSTGTGGTHCFFNPQNSCLTSSGSGCPGL
jgi:hypothetical protein